MQIGLIGGIGPAATDYYYRQLIKRSEKNNTPLDMTIAHADAPTLIENLANNDVDAQVNIYQRLTDRLQAAGAGCVVVTSIAGHFCIDAFKRRSSLAVIDMISAVDDAVRARGFTRLGIIGTRTVMESQFYAGISNVELIAPSGKTLDDVHDAYIAMAISGQLSAEQRGVFDLASEWLLDKADVDAILLCGTDLALVYN